MHILVDAEGRVIHSPETEAEIAGLRAENAAIKQREAALVAVAKAAREAKRFIGMPASMLKAPQDMFDAEKNLVSALEAVGM